MIGKHHQGVDITTVIFLISLSCWVLTHQILHYSKLTACCRHHIILRFTHLLGLLSWSDQLTLIMVILPGTNYRWPVRQLRNRLVHTRSNRDHQFRVSIVRILCVLLLVKHSFSLLKVRFYGLFRVNYDFLERRLINSIKEVLTLFHSCGNGLKLRKTPDLERVILTLSSAWGF